MMRLRPAPVFVCLEGAFSRSHKTKPTAEHVSPDGSELTSTF